MKLLSNICLFIFFINVHLFSQTSAVVTTEPVSCKIGNNILKQGGNAFDAAVAIGFALSVTYPRAGNISGGGFALIYKKGSEPIALDFREQAPLKSKTDMYLDKNKNVIKGMSTNTIHSVGVPGTIKGLYEIWEKYGSLPFKKLIEPSIKVAETGIKVNKLEAEYFKKYEKNLILDNGCKKIFFKNGKVLKKGDFYKRLNLAKSLRKIATNGAKEFYNGELGKQFVKEIKNLNGIITLNDLKNYKVYYRTPIKTNFKNDTLYLMPLPSSGGIVISQILKMIELGNYPKLKHNSFEYINLISEMEKRCYADRNTYLGDPDFYPIKFQKLISDKYLLKRLKDISIDKATSSKKYKTWFWRN